MLRRIGVGLCACWIMGAVLCIVPAAADDVKKGETPASQASCIGEDGKDCASSSWMEGWYVVWGASNLFPGLKESEAKIDRLLNRGVGSIFPRWERPTTFKDWRNDMKLWDAFVGVGRPINEKWSWTGTYGYSRGLIQNAKVYYPLGMPLKMHVNFKRSVYFLCGSLSYYPWGVPKLEETDAQRNVLVRMLRGARPYGELTTGYVHVSREGNTWATLPNIARLLRYTDVQHDNLFYLSPRVAVEMPITENDSFNIMVGRLFFTSHSKEYDSTSIYFFHRHRF